MKTETEIKEAIRAIDLWIDRNPTLFKQVGRTISVARDTLAWAAGLPPIIQYPPIDDTIENQRNRDKKIAEN